MSRTFPGFVVNECRDVLIIDRRQILAPCEISYFCNVTNIPDDRRFNFYTVIYIKIRSAFFAGFFDFDLISRNECDRVGHISCLRRLKHCRKHSRCGLCRCDLVSA